MELIGELMKSGLEILKKSLPRNYTKDYPLIVNFSGGKDSTACLILACEFTDNVEAFYMDSGFELPITLRYVKKRCKEFGIPLNVSHPEKHKIGHLPDSRIKDCYSIYDYIREYGYFPTEVRRYCSIRCKQRPARVLIRKKWGHAKLFRVVGVRRNESVRRMYVYGRKGRKRFGGTKYTRPDYECAGTTLVYPILDWSEKNVISFLEQKGVEIHQGYKLFGVSGCAWCPIHKPDEVRRIATVYPHIYDRFLECEKYIGKPAWLKKDVWLKDVLKGVVK